MVSPNLIAAARAGEGADLDRLMEAIWPHAFRIALSLLRDRESAQDAAQEACAIVFRNVGRLRSVDAFGTWLYRIVVREALALERRLAPSRLIGELNHAFSTDDTILRIDVLDALARLTSAQRAVVTLHYYAGMNSREIAATLEIPDSTVRYHLMNAKKHLEHLLGDHRDRTLSYLEARHLAT